MASATPSPPASQSRTKDQSAVLPLNFRAASSTLTVFDDEHSIAPSSSLRNGFLASSPLSSPPSSPCPDQRRVPSSSFVTGAGTKRRATTPLLEPERDVASISVSVAPGEHGCARTKRRRKDMNVDDDNPLGDRNPLSRASALVQHPPPALANTHLPKPASPAHASAPTTSSSTIDRNPYDADANDGKCTDGERNNDEEEVGNQSCPHPALLGILIEFMKILPSHAHRPTIYTNSHEPRPRRIAEYPHAVVTSTLTSAVRSRVLGCVRSSGEAVPPSCFYDPDADPDRERGDHVRCLMPRAGKRRETMKYKQYYWAPVVVGRGRTRTWDVDWEE